MEEVTFRCSGLHNLMGQKGLGQTGRTFIEDTWRQNKFGYKEIIKTPAMTKGHLCEAKSRALVKEVLGGEFRKRNEKRFFNEFINGEPDVILEKEDFIEDNKNAENLRTFMNVKEVAKAYYWQAMGYMWLTGKKNFRLIYSLNPDPYEMIQEKQKRLYFQYDCNEENPDYIEECRQIEHNNNLINGLDKKKRIKVFTLEYDQQQIDRLTARVIEAKQIYNQIQL